jgi:hypothetical protein
LPAQGTWPHLAKREQALLDRLNPIFNLLALSG